MSALLYYNGFDVHQATHAVEGLELARAWDTDAIVMDVRMPVVNGLLATEILKSTPEIAHLPVIMVSCEEINEQRARDSGACCFLRKPIEPVDFVNAVYDAVSARKPTP
jgi:CheY-like chemotaxis protein